MNNHPGPNSNFLNLVKDIGAISRKKHETGILGNSEKNLHKIKKSIKDLPKAIGQKAMASMEISGGPSVLRRRSIEKLKELEFQGSIISADASYIGCLRRGLIPDYVVTLDPHPTRIVLWFGDPKYAEHSATDNYFERQDINVEFRRNSLQQD